MAAPSPCRAGPLPEGVAAFVCNLQRQLLELQNQQAAASPRSLAAPPGAPPSTGTLAGTLNGAAGGGGHGTLAGPLSALPPMAVAGSWLELAAALQRAAAGGIGGIAAAAAAATPRRAAVARYLEKKKARTFRKKVRCGGMGQKLTVLLWAASIGAVKRAVATDGGRLRGSRAAN